MFHLNNIDVSRFRIPLIAFLVGAFALISWSYFSRYYYVGSYESAVSLSKRPAVIDWDKFSTSGAVSPSHYVIADSFLNFDSQVTGLRKEPNSFPSTYYKGEESIFPMYMRPKNGGLPLYLIRKVSEWTSPEMARPFYNWLACFIAFTFSCLYIRKRSGSIVPFVLLAVTTPQIFFLNYSNFPSASLTFALSLAILYWIEIAERKLEYLFIGLLCSICFFCKLANILTFVPFALFYWKKIWDNKYVLFSGLVPWILVTLVSLDFGHFVTVVLDERKGEISYLSAIAQGLVQIISPDLQFRHVMYFLRPVSEVIGNSLLWFSVSLGVAVAFIAIFFRNCVPKSLGWKVTAIFVWQYVVFMMLAPRIKGDLLSYFDRAFYLSVVLLAAHSLKPNRLVNGVFLVFIIFRGGMALNWRQEFNQYTKSLQGCSWVYECIYKDWDDGKLLAGKPLVTLNYLDVGQFEFLSGEKLIPIHVNSRLTRTPSREEMIRFFSSFPAREFYVLESGKPDGKSLESYLPRFRYILKYLGMNVELVKSYHYPELLKSYFLLKVTKT